MVQTQMQTAQRSRAAQLGQGLLHSSSQIYFQQNILAGILIFGAFFLPDWRLGILAILGAIGGMFGGLIMQFSLTNVSTGMQGFSGTLVGSAMYAAMGGSEWYVYVFALVGGVATGPVTWLINALFTRTAMKKWNLPYTTAPFVIVATIITVSASDLSVPTPTSDLPTEPVAAFFISLLTNISQVILVDNPISGALILLGLFIASWKVGLAAIMGSVIGTVVAVIMGESWNEIVNGLANYSGVLTAIALTLTFLRGSLASWLYAIPWVAITAMITLVFHRLGLVTYTWPYILTTWFAIIVAYYVSRMDHS